MLETLIPALVPVIEWLAQIFSNVLGNAIESVKNLLKPLTGAFEGVVKFIKVFSVATGKRLGTVLFKFLKMYSISYQRLSKT